MRIRNYRPEDLPALVQIQQEASLVDGNTFARVEASIETWLTNKAMDARSNVFVITDDDDDVNTWGQAGTLDGTEGELVGYTTLTLYEDTQAYHFLCQGAVHPEYRQQGAGRLLLVGALNRARIMAAEFEFEAEQEGRAIYFEGVLPLRKTVSSRLTEKCELRAVGEEPENGMRLYRRELW